MLENIVSALDSKMSIMDSHFVGSSITKNFSPQRGRKFCTLAVLLQKQIKIKILFLFFKIGI